MNLSPIYCFADRQTEFYTEHTGIMTESTELTGWNSSVTMNDNLYHQSPRLGSCKNVVPSELEKRK